MSCKELGYCQSVLKTSKILDGLKKSATLFRSNRGKDIGKLLPPKLEKPREDIGASRSRDSSGVKTTVGTEQEGKPIVEELLEAQ